MSTIICIVNDKPETLYRNVGYAMGRIIQHHWQNVPKNSIIETVGHSNEANHYVHFYVSMSYTDSNCEGIISDIVKVPDVLLLAGNKFNEPK